jgi:D-alanyl-D-alanine carboxypeptidase (penicillin-binding protein 5/6)
MDRHDEWFTPANLEEQIEHYQQDGAQSGANTQLLHDLEHLAKDDTHRLAQIRERLVEHATHHLGREPVPLQRYQSADILPPGPASQPLKKQSPFLVKLISGIAAVFVIASMLLAFTVLRPSQEQTHLKPKKPALNPMLTLTPVTNTPAFAIKGKAAFLMDASTGNVLVDINSHTHLPMGNLAQIMTAVVAIDNVNLDQYTTVEQTTLAEMPQGASTAGLQVGDLIQLRELLYALLLPSGDDAALVIAHAVGGNTPDFVSMMNNEAQQLGLNDTHFSSPYGSSAPDEYSSAADLTHLASYAMQLSDFAQAVAAPEHTLAPTYRNHSYTWDTTNTLLTSYSGMNGIKTGYDSRAGASMVFAAQRNNHLLIGCESGVQSVALLATDVKKLLDRGFAG